MTSDAHPSYIVVGHISSLHGVHGELYVSSLTDSPDETFRPGRTLRVSDREGRRPDEFFPPVEIEEVRPYRRGFLVQFRGLERREEAEFLKGRYLVVPFDELAPRDEGEFFYHELLGARVVTRDGRELGTVREVFPLEPSHLLEVSDGRREYLIPLARDVVVEVDVEARRILVDPPEGLLDL